MVTPSDSWSVGNEGYDGMRSGKLIKICPKKLPTSPPKATEMRADMRAFVLLTGPRYPQDRSAARRADVVGVALHRD
jgi:hypothetical protein